MDAGRTARCQRSRPRGHHQMKFPSTISSVRRQAGILLIECMVYISVFAILTGIGTAAFYFCWDHTRAVIYATDDIASALRAGERWRADVRGTVSAWRWELELTPRRKETQLLLLFTFAAAQTKP